MRSTRLSPSNTLIRFVIVMACTIFLLLAVPASSAQATAQEDAPPPPGKLVDIGGWKLHLNCTGANRNGAPTVVFENGAGGLSFDWYFVQQGVAKFTQACSYDRAGTAWSDVGPHPRTIRQGEYELHKLLENAGVRGPYVLVGHSFGGVMVRNFQAQFPKDVAGMVLVDPTSDDSRLVHFGKMIRVREDTSGKPIPPIRTSILPEEKNLSGVAPAPGPVRLSRPPGQTARALPPEVERLRAWAGQRRERGTIEADGAFTGQEFADLYAARKAQAHVLGDMPLIVLIARKRQEPANLPPEWHISNDEINGQLEELALMSSRGRFIYAENSTHLMTMDEPEVVVEAIRNVVNASHQGSHGTREAGEDQQEEQ